MKYDDWRELGEFCPNGFTVERRAVGANCQTETTEYGMWTRLDEARSFVWELDEGVGVDPIWHLAYPNRPYRKPAMSFDLSGGDRSVLACITSGPPLGYRWIKQIHAGTPVSELARREGISRQAIEQTIRDQGWRQRWAEFEQPPEAGTPVHFAGPVLLGEDGATTLNNMADLPMVRMRRWAAMWDCVEEGPTVSPELLAGAIKMLHLEAASQGKRLTYRIDSVFVATLIYCAGITIGRAGMALGTPWATYNLANMLREHVKTLTDALR